MEVRQVLETRDQLPTVFTGRGEVKAFIFTQHVANQQAFVYQVNCGGTEHFEVFLRKVNKRFGQESYPKAKAFGVWAWSYFSIDAAMRKFNQLMSEKGGVELWTEVETFAQVIVVKE